MGKFNPPPRQHAKSNKIDTDKLEATLGQSLANSKELKFSFKYFELNDAHFKVTDCDSNWFIRLLERKKNYCTMTFDKIIIGGRATRCHQIDWKDTSLPKGFNIKNFSPDISPYQLAISQKKGRIIGFPISDTFYIVWLDPEHALYN